jgi:hypothetical protein
MMPATTFLARTATLAALIMAVAAAAETAEPPMAAEGYDPATHQLLFKRVGVLSFDGDRRLGSIHETYTGADGEHLAEFHLYLPGSAQMPSGTLRLRDGGERGMYVINDTHFMVYRRNATQARPHKTYIERVHEIVIGTQLEHLVLEHARDLLDGRQVRHRYVSLVMAHAGRVVLIPRDRDPASGTLRVEVKTSPGRLLPHGASFTLDTESGRLLDYVGTAGIPDQNGDPFAVRLVYRYIDRP